MESFEQFFAMIGARIGDTDRVRLLGHVEALPGVIDKQCYPGAPHPGPLPHRGQDEQGAG